MTWHPRWHHVSQLYRHPGDAPGALEGANDCFEASLARYLREAGYSYSGNDDGLIGDLRLQATGQPDHAGQGFTSLDQARHLLTDLHIRWHWTESLTEARGAPWAVMFVRASRLRATAFNLVSGQRVYTDYPAQWVADTGPDHFVLRLPDGTFNDPLSYWNGSRDTSYTSTSLATAFAGAFVLDAPPPGLGMDGTPRSGSSFIVTPLDGVNLRTSPVLGSSVLRTLGRGTTVRDAYSDACLWSFVEIDGLHGWIKREFLKRA